MSDNPGHFERVTSKPTSEQQPLVFPFWSAASLRLDVQNKISPEIQKSVEKTRRLPIDNPQVNTFVAEFVFEFQRELLRLQNYDTAPLIFEVLKSLSILSATEKEPVLALLARQCLLRLFVFAERAQPAKFDQASDELLFPPQGNEESRHHRNWRRFAKKLLLGATAATVASGAAAHITHVDQQVGAELKTFLIDHARSNAQVWFPNDLKSQAFFLQWLDRVEHGKVDDAKQHFEILFHLLDNTPAGRLQVIKDTAALWNDQDQAANRYQEEVKVITRDRQQAEEAEAAAAEKPKQPIFEVGNHGQIRYFIYQPELLDFFSKGYGAELATEVDNYISQAMEQYHLPPEERGEVEFIVYQLWLTESINTPIEDRYGITEAVDRNVSEDTMRQTGYGQLNKTNFPDLYQVVDFLFGQEFHKTLDQLLVTPSDTLSAAIIDESDFKYLRFILTQLHFDSSQTELDFVANWLARPYTNYSIGTESQTDANWPELVNSFTKYGVQPEQLLDDGLQDLLFLPTSQPDFAALTGRFALQHPELFKGDDLMDWVGNLDSLLRFCGSNAYPKMLDLALQLATTHHTQFADTVLLLSSISDHLKEADPSAVLSEVNVATLAQKSFALAKKLKMSVSDFQALFSEVGPIGKDYEDSLEKIDAIIGKLPTLSLQKEAWQGILWFYSQTTVPVRNSFLEIMKELQPQHLENGYASLFASVVLSDFQGSNSGYDDITTEVLYQLKGIYLQDSSLAQFASHDLIGVDTSEITNTELNNPVAEAKHFLLVLQDLRKLITTQAITQNDSKDLDYPLSEINQIITKSDFFGTYFLESNLFTVTATENDLPVVVSAELDPQTISLLKAKSNIETDLNDILAGTSLPGRVVVLDPFFKTFIINIEDGQLGNEGVDGSFQNLDFLVVDQSAQAAHIVHFPAATSSDYASDLDTLRHSQLAIRVNILVRNGIPLETQDSHYQDTDTRPILVIGQTTTGTNKVYVLFIKAGEDLGSFWSQFIAKQNLDPLHTQAVLMDNGSAFGVIDEQKKAEIMDGIPKEFFLVAQTKSK